MHEINLMKRQLTGTQSLLSTKTDEPLQLGVLAGLTPRDVECLLYDASDRDNSVHQERRILGGDYGRDLHRSFEL